MSNNEKQLRKKSKKVGLLPGSLIYTGKKEFGKVTIKIFDYNKTKFKEYTIDKIDTLSLLEKKSTVTWINICGVNNPEVIKEIGKYFKLHSLLLEDIMDTTHRPKIEHFPEHTFLILKYFNHDHEKMDIQQISIIIGNNFIISFQENEQDIFAPIEERLKQNKGIIRNEQSDYLAYALIDLIIDRYFIILENMEDSLEKIEKASISNPTSKILQKINKIKKEVIFLHKIIFSSRDIINNLIKIDSKFIKSSTKIYLSDVYDHSINILDTLDTFKSTVQGIIDIYFSSLNNKMNEIIKVLTIMTSVFIPLTFITGIYGMNFRNMPEIKWQYGYYFTLGLMFLIGIAMAILFKKKKWI